MPDASLRPPAGIDAELLAELMEKVSEFGSTGDGGVDRPALTDAHKATLRYLAGSDEVADWPITSDTAKP